MVNINAVLRVAGLYCLIWLGFLLVPTLAGEPKVICATPFGLILTLVAGLGVMPSTRGGNAHLRPWTFIEAACAGAFVGSFQGLLAGIWLPVLASLRQDTVAQRAWGTVPWLLPAVLVAGGALGAILGVIGYGIRSGGALRR
jgi:hypothetical protein